MVTIARGSLRGDHERMWIRTPPWLVKSSSCIDSAPFRVAPRAIRPRRDARSAASDPARQVVVDGSARRSLPFS
jgi:hypothetical protein